MHGVVSVQYKGLCGYILVIQVEFIVRERKKKPYSPGPHQYEIILLFCF
jgi:hypothetical protein